MEALWLDLKYGARMLRSKPLFTFLAVLTLALGIGANAAIFSIVNTLFLRPLPLKDMDRLVFPLAMRGEDPFQISPIEFIEWRDRCGSLEQIGAAQGYSANLVADAEPERVEAAAVMPEYLSVLSVEPVMGRLFIAEEVRANGPKAVLLGHGLWKRRFGSDQNVVGKIVKIGNDGFTVAGVMPPQFDLPFGTELWTPLAVDDLPQNARVRRNCFAVGKMKSGFTIGQVQEELRAISQSLEEKHPTQKGWTVNLVPLRNQLMQDISGALNKKLTVLLSAVGFLLLIACANVASLLLARMLQRGHEFSVRSALGAGRGRLIRQLVTESLLLAALGGGAGLLFAHWIAPPLFALSPIEPLALKTYFSDIEIDRRVLGFTLLTSILTAVAFNLPIAFRATRIDMQQFLKEGGRGVKTGSRRLLGGLVVVEVAVSIMMLVGAGLTVKSFMRLLQLDLGFRPDNLLTMQIALSPDKYAEANRRTAFVDQALERARSIPGVESAAITTNLPLSHNSLDAWFIWEGGEPPDPNNPDFTANRLASPGYIETIGLTLVKGRTITDQDRADSLPVVVISESLARRCWPGEDPIGKRVKWRSPITERPWMTVVGLVKDVKEDRAAFRRARPVWYIPYAQQSLPLPVSLVVKMQGDPLKQAASVRDAVKSVDGDQPIYDVLSMEERMADLHLSDRFSAILMGLFGALGLALSALGIFGVLSYTVSRRIQEIGVRIALGAQPLDILKMVIGEGLALTAAGIAAGLAASLLLTKLMSSLLFEVSAADPAVYALVSALLLAVAFTACYIPARRATQVDPMTALRYE